MKIVLYHLFEMERSGNGWKTISYRSNFNSDLDANRPCVDMFGRYKTLSKIKDDFDGTNFFSCVAISQNNPKLIFQYIVEYGDNVAANITEYIPSNSLDYLTEYSWVDKVPKPILTEWRDT